MDYCFIQLFKLILQLTSVTNGKNRYMVGWEPIRENCRDSGRHLWGGNILVHELVQREDGTLGVRMPDTIEQSFTEEKNGRILMDRYNRIGGDQYYLDERSVRFTKNSAKVSLMVSGKIMLVYVNDVALVSRCYEIASG